MKCLDKNNAGAVTLEDFSAGLKAMNIFCSKHEEHALLRRFDTNNEGKISMEEFYNTLAALFWKKWTSCVSINNYICFKNRSP